MSKKKSIVLLTIISIVTVILTVMTFARFTVPFYKNGTYKYNSILDTIALDQDLTNGIAYDLTLKDNLDVVDEDIDVNEVLKTLDNRLSALGYDNSVVTAYRASSTENYSFRIEMRESATFEADAKVVSAYGELTFTDGNGNELMTGKKGVKSAKYTTTTVSGTTSYFVKLTFTDEGNKIITDAMSKAEADKKFKLTIKLGETELFSNELSADYINEKTIFITSQSAETAKQLALQISSGGLKYEYELSDPYSITPSLGKNAAEYATWALGITLLLIFIGLVLLFGGFGLIADVSIFVFILFELILMILIPGITMNLGGLIGILLSVLLTTGLMANIMKKVKNEYANGKTIKAAIKAGYTRTLFASLEISGILAALSLLLFFICGGYVQCLAITLGVGAVLSFGAVAGLSRLLVAIMLPLLKDRSEGFLTLKREEATI